MQWLIDRSAFDCGTTVAHRSAGAEQSKEYVTLDNAQLEKFPAALRGRLIQSADSDYDDARTIYNAMIDKRPRQQTENVYAFYMSGMIARFCQPLAPGIL